MIYSEYQNIVDNNYLLTNLKSLKPKTEKEDRNPMPFTQEDQEIRTKKSSKQIAPESLNIVNY